MKTLIVGAGAMGCFFASMIKRANGEVTIYDINQDKVDIINNSGITIHEKNGENVVVDVSAFANVEEVPKVDLIILLVKSYKTERVARDLALVDDGSFNVLTLQNGLGNTDELVKHFDQQRIYSGITYQGAYQIAYAEINHTGNGLTTIAPLSKNMLQTAMDLARFLSNCNIPTGATTDLDSISWKKLIVNSAINPLSAIHGLKNGELPKNAEAVRDMVALVVEGVTVAQKIGIPLSYGETWAEVLDTCRDTAENRSSMLTDIDNGRSTEIEAINGSIVRFGEANGIDTPTNVRMIRKVTALHRSFII